MPLQSRRAAITVPFDTPAYFESLQDLDIWYSNTNAHIKQDGILPYTPRSSNLTGSDGEHPGKLLVCHDYKGGYTESPIALSYTFNFWQYCESFIYFSHHRITVPPSGWINAAHRQGVKMLGTLIFESSGEADTLRLLVGRLPSSVTGPAAPPLSINITLPLSRHYASILAQLADECGFEGYLLNVECPLIGGPEQVRVLDAWITLLRAELRRRVGAHSSVIWYDSVLVDGRLRWQDRLNSLNLPFFLSSDEFFTNYTWPPNYPSITAQYFLSLDPTLLQSSSATNSISSTQSQNSAVTKMKSLQDIYMGVDTWGRGSHGGGGYCIHKALEHIDPKFLGLSVALFGQAWTWENEQDEPGWDWERWWRSERTLWIGPSEGEEKVVIRPADPNAKSCESHGEFVPVNSFFSSRPPPNPRDLPFFTTFSPGVGYKWFVEGREIMPKGSGWTDVYKQTSLGDLLWPVPRIEVEGMDDGEVDNEAKATLPKASVALSFENAWNGGSSIVLSLSNAVPADPTDAAASFQCFWIPIQSIAVSAGFSYDATLVYKQSYVDGIDVNIGLSAKIPVDGVAQAIVIDVLSDEQASNGWNRVSIRLSCSSSAESLADLPMHIGLVIAIAAEDFLLPAYDISIELGQLTVHPSIPVNLNITEPRIIWADYTTVNLSGKECLALTWDVASSFVENVNLQGLTSSEDPNPIWKIDHSLDASWFPNIVYCNIYAIAKSGGSQDQSDSTAGNDTRHPSNATFITTSGLDGACNRVLIEKSVLNDVTAGEGRIYVQGITELGTVLPWERCAFVELVR